MDYRTYIKNTFRYDSETGLLWRHFPKFSRVTGTLGDQGYLVVTVKRNTMRVHCLCWFLYHNQMPKNQLDHINRIKTDNRISNLRIATHSQNIINRPKQKNNTTGYKGVTRMQDGRVNEYRAQINIDNKHYSLGNHYTAEEAADAYNDAAKTLHGEFAVFNEIKIKKE